MNKLTFIFLFFVTISTAQSHEKFLSDFLQEDELKTENALTDYNQYDFSGIWTQTENYQVLGIIGSDFQRLRIKLISIQKNSSNPNEYFVSGKSFVKNNICDFNGTIQIREISELKELHFGVDNDYKNRRIKSQGILVADFELTESPNLKYAGIFKGQLFTKWYLDSTNQIQYDDIQANSDEYLNNAFIGIWVDNLSHKEKICKWADFRVPEVDSDFDVGAAEFSPSEKYLTKGWKIIKKRGCYKICKLKMKKSRNGGNKSFCETLVVGNFSLRYTQRSLLKQILETRPTSTLNRYGP